jgi:hypothetical protein
MSARDFYNLVTTNIETEYMLISFFRDEYNSEYEYKCERQSVRDAIIGVFHLHLQRDKLALAQIIDEYSTYLATRIYT